MGSNHCQQQNRSGQDMVIIVTLNLFAVKRLNFQLVFCVSSAPSGWHFPCAVFWCTFYSINFFLLLRRRPHFEIVLQSGLFLLIFKTPKAILSLCNLHAQKEFFYGRSEIILSKVTDFLFKYSQLSPSMFIVESP